MNPIRKLLVSESDQRHLDSAELETYQRGVERAIRAVELSQELAEHEERLVQAALEAVDVDAGAAREPRRRERLRGELGLILRTALAAWGLGEPARCEADGLEWLRAQHEAYEQPPQLASQACAALREAARAQLSSELSDALSAGLEAAERAFAPTPAQA